MTLPKMDSLSYLYTPIEEVATLYAARAQMAVPAQNCFEAFLSAKPRAILFRQVATPNLEFERFVQLAEAAGLSATVLEYHDDKFVTCNPCKLALGQLTCKNPPGSLGNPKCYRIVDVERADGKSISSVQTKWGERLTDFHRRLLRTEPSFANVETLDCSEWFFRNGPRAKEYYYELFSLFVNRAVLFESFLLTGRDHSFTRDVIFPCFEAAALRHGARPLVCRLDPVHEEGAAHWYHYSSQYLSKINTICSP